MLGLALRASLFDSDFSSPTLCSKTIWNTRHKATILTNWLRQLLPPIGSAQNGNHKHPSQQSGFVDSGALLIHRSEPCLFLQFEHWPLFFGRRACGKHVSSCKLSTTHRRGILLRTTWSSCTGFDQQPVCLRLAARLFTMLSLIFLCGNGLSGCALALWYAATNLSLSHCCLSTPYREYILKIQKPEPPMSSRFPWLRMSCPNYPLDQPPASRWNREGWHKALDLPWRDLVDHSLDSTRFPAQDLPCAV